MIGGMKGNMYFFARFICLICMFLFSTCNDLAWVTFSPLLVVTKLESAYAIATIFDDSDSEGGATSEIIDPVKNSFYNSNFLCLIFNYIMRR